ncbi:MAG: SWIM zinc finger family protein, partial [Isosphaeraceae bacterium]
MSAEWTAERVMALAPDAASAKAGQGLASAKKWANLGRGEGLVWGECQGSGSKPYQTKIDPDDPAFSCSCPSRKFPCKHALGLMLVWANGSATITEADPPAWVVSWKENREKKAEKAKEKTDRPPSPADPKAQAKREAARAAKVAAGLDDLALWINDLVRQGFTTLGAKSGNVWTDQARRMIDAQGPGVARMLRQIDAMSFAGEGWQTALLDRLARIHLLSEGFRHLDALPADVAAEVRSMIGFPNDLDAIRAGPGVRDYWQVIGQSVAVEDRLSVRRTWLIGRSTHQPALLLDFAIGGKAFETNLTPGVVIDADLAFIPGSFPMRALVKERHATEPLETLSNGLTIVSAFAAFGEALTKNPWLEIYPVILENIIITESEGRWSARDASGAVVPLSKRFADGWHVLAMGGGTPITITGEFDGVTLTPLGCLVGERFLPLATTPSESFEEPGPPPLMVPLLVEATASAVVGVDRKPLPTPSADDPIGAALIGLETKDPPSRLLAVAAAAALYSKVGRTPMINSSPAPDLCPPEVQPECSPEAARRLRAILGGEQANLLPAWLGLLAESGRRLPADLIVAVLDHQQKQFLPVEPLTKGLGVRGRWLAAQNPKWRKFAGVAEDADPMNVWETGVRLERIAVLRELRKTDPGRGRDLVALTFASEPAADRSAFLREFEHGLSMDDEPFLEAALDDRSKEVRQIAADLLRRLPASRLCLRMIERSKELLAWTNG